MCRGARVEHAEGLEKSHFDEAIFRLSSGFGLGRQFSKQEQRILQRGPLARVGSEQLGRDETKW